MQKINYGFVIVDKDNIPRHDIDVSHDPDYDKQVADTYAISQRIPNRMQERHIVLLSCFYGLFS